MIRPSEQLWQKLGELRRLRDYPAIIQCVDEAASRIRGMGEPEELARLLNVKAGAQFSLFQYQKALRSYQEAKALAAVRPDWRLLSILNSNLSALYLQQDEINAARHAAQEAVSCLGRSGGHKSGNQIRIQAAVVEARTGNMAGAEALLLQAARDAEAGGDWEGVALAWDQWGYELLRSQSLSAAEEALLESYRIRRWTRSPSLANSYYTLGLLRLAQGDARGSLRLLDRAAAGIGNSGLALPVWRLHFERGRAHKLAGEAWAAQREFERALDGLVRLRLDWLPAEAFWNASSSEQHRVYREYLANCLNLHSLTGQQRYLADALASLAESQAAGLRALLDTPGEWRSRLPEQYWGILAELRDLEMEAGSPAPAPRSARLKELQYRLTEMELASGFKPEVATERRTTGPEFVKSLQQRLDSNSALIAFHLGERESYRWAVTRTGFEFRKLEGAGSILALAAALREAVMQDSPDAVPLGQAAYRKLFAGLSKEVTGKRRWVLGLESGLFLTPFAALVVESRQAGPVYLVENHALQLTPTPAILEGTARPLPGPFVAVADPVYNSADPRWIRPAAVAGHGARVLPGWFRAAEKTPKGLARLAGSVMEAENCAHVWSQTGRNAVHLRGWDATVSNLRRALASDPAVVHIAAHFVSPAAVPERPLLALSLTPDGSPEWLSPVEISRWRYRIGTVVLSGCSSAVGSVSPAEGLMGMTRAWLAAGARSVIASLWPVPDDSGELFQRLYRYLAVRSYQGAGGTAEALRKAQIDMVHSSDGRVRPAHWAAYILVGKE